MAALNKTERMETRITPDQKALFERAAYLEGQTLTDFVLNAVRDAARQVIEHHEVIVLTQRERKAFFKALLNPPAPNKALRDTAKAHKKLIRESA